MFCVGGCCCRMCFGLGLFVVSCGVILMLRCVLM